MQAASQRQQSGFTRIEVIVVLLVVAALMLLVFLTLQEARAKAPRTQCMQNVQRIGLAVRIFANDGHRYPPAVPVRFGGSQDYIGDPAATFKHFLVLTNELREPRALVCPTDQRPVAPGFDRLNNSNLSYFISLDAHETLPRMFLTGDRNVTSDVAMTNGLLVLGTNSTLGWTGEMHQRSGHVGFVDG